MRRRWLAVVSDVRATLLDSDTPDQALGLITDRVIELTGADASWLMVGPDSDGGWLVIAQSGNELPELTGTSFTAEESPPLAAVTATLVTLSVCPSKD